MEKILSILITADNAGDALKNSLRAFAKSPLIDNLDIMVINDGSNEDAETTAMEYASLCPNSIKLINKGNGGWGSIINAGISEARGKYFIQLDGNDFFSDENLYSFITFLKDNSADMVYTPYIIIDASSGAIISVVEQYDCFPYDESIPLYELDNFIPSIYGLTIRTEILKSNKIHVIESCQFTDVEYILKSYNFCKDMLYYERPICNHRIDPQKRNFNILDIRKTYRDHQNVLLYLLEYLNDSVKVEYVAHEFHLQLRKLCLMQYLFYMTLPKTADRKREFRNFDNKLKLLNLELYNDVNNRSVTILRKYNFNGYFLISYLKMKKDKRLHINLYEK